MTPVIKLPFTRGNPHGHIVIVGEAPGGDEQRAFAAGRSATAFIGMSGNELDRILKDAGIDEADCYFTNVCKERPPNNEIKLFDKPKIYKWISVLHKELESLPNATVIVPVGNLALQATTGIQTIRWYAKDPNKIKTLAGIGKHRGSIYESLPFGDSGKKIKVIPTYHPAYVLKDYATRVTVVADFERIKEDATFKELRLPQHNILIEPTLRQTLSYLEVADKTYRIATDIENMYGFISCIGIATNTTNAISIPFMWPDGSSYWSLEDEAEVLQALAKLLSTHKGQVGQFYYHDAYWYHHYGLIEALKTRFEGCLWDTFSQHVCLYGELPHGIGYMTSIYTRVPYYKDEGRTWRKRDDIEQYWKYNGKDCIVTLECSYALEQELEEFGQLDFYDTYYRRLFPHLLQSAVRGIAIDETVRSEARMDYGRQWVELQTKLQEKTNRPMDFKLSINDNHNKWKSDLNYLNVSAHAKLKEFLNRDCHMKTGNTQKKTLEALRGRYPDHAAMVNHILDIKSVRKTKETYLDPKVGHDTRFHFILKASTETGRLASQTDPMGYGENVQTIPDGICRAAFIPDPNKTLIYADLAQAEARIVAYLSGCVRLLETFEAADKGGPCVCGSGLPANKCCADVHKLNAANVFSKPVTEVTPEERALGKKIRHARNYSMGARTFSINTGLPEAICKKLLRLDERTYPEIPRWWKDIEREIIATRRLVNPLGRIRFFFGRIRAHATLREALAQIPQSTVPDLVNLAYMSIQEEGLQVLMQGHDALLIQAWDYELEKACKFIIDEMEIPFYINGIRVVIPVDVKVGKCWDGAQMFTLEEWREKQCA